MFIYKKLLWLSKASKIDHTNVTSFGIYRTKLRLTANCRNHREIKWLICDPYSINNKELFAFVRVDTEWLRKIIICNSHIEVYRIFLFSQCISAQDKHLASRPVPRSIFCECTAITLRVYWATLSWIFNKMFMTLTFLRHTSGSIIKNNILVSIM